MYLNSNKSDTNIDKDFQQHKNNNFNFKKFIQNNKKIITTIVIVLAVILGIIFIISLFPKNKLILNGATEITIYKDSDYIEPGFKAYNKKNDDLSNKVVIVSNLNTDKIGEYKITYNLKGKERTRKIKVIEKPTEYTYIYLETVNNLVDIYLKVGQTYKEPGYKVYNSSGKNLTEKVKVTNKVNTSKKGSYKIIYSVVDSQNVTVTAIRTVVVS